MNPKQAASLRDKILQLQALMVAYATDGRATGQPAQYRKLYTDVTLDLEAAKYADPNPHQSLEVFAGFYRLREMLTYASRREYVQSLYDDVLMDLARIERNEGSSRNWAKANDTLAAELAPVRAQWLKAKGFIFSSSPDYENSIKESINSIESVLKIRLKRRGGTLGSIIKGAGLQPDIERLVSAAYGYSSNMDAVRHGGTQASKLTKADAEFFLEFSAASIVYIAAKTNP